MLASAGLNRLGKADRARSLLDPEKFPPAPAQGAIGLEIRASDIRTAGLIAPLGHGPTAVKVTAERAFLRKLDGSCRTPIGAFSRLDGDVLTLTGQILSPDGTQCFTATSEGKAADADALGWALGQRLLDEAGADFLTLFN
jgi:hydroxymethylbilane synthase